MENERNELMGFKITVSTHHTHQKSKNTSLGKWVQPMNTIKIGKYSIDGGFIYVGGILKGLDDYYTESSLVDPSLTIDEKPPDYNADEMGYWPSYCDISPSSRAAYLEWLASDRNNPETPIAFVFLYFYGLERRLLFDSLKGVVTVEERVELIKELYRLKGIYGDNRSFNGYVNNLLAFVWVQNEGSYKIDNKLVFSGIEFSVVFKLFLAKDVNKRKPISNVLALAWIRNHPDINLKTPAIRCKNEFNQLFKLRYTQKYGEGLSISANKTKLKFDYYPASSSLRGYQGIKLDLPDASRLKAPVKKIAMLAEACTVELDSYSRFLGRNENNRASLSLLALLPSELIDSVNNPIFTSLKQWLIDQLVQSKGVISVNALLEKFADERPLTINKKESEMIATIIEKAGFGMAPDIRFHHAKLDIKGSVVIFKEGHGEGFIPSHSFNQVGTILRLGSIVAKIDGHVDVTEVLFLENLIENDNQLNEKEKSSLNAYLHWQLNTSLNMAGLKARLSSISDREKTAIGHILIGVALADGKIDSIEIKQLEKLYTSLGLNKSSILNDIHQMSSSRGISKQFDTSVVIKDSRNKQTIQRSQEFSINKELLKLYEEETAGVKGILESIFIDDDYLAGELSQEEPSANAEYENDEYLGLDEKHSILYQQLIVKEEWSQNEVKSLCKNLNLMVDGACEIINDWAFDKVDAPVIENGNTLFVDLELVKEITAI
ncbi:MAG: TerB N-terminal domain-containing protein [Methylococcales bacterium]|nr:TerB N-terminal domain-containing protein [Methylococcales bacterium]